MSESLVLLRKNNSADITAFHDAVMYYSMLGDGIFDGVYESFETVGPLNNVFSIKSGMLLFGGRLCVIAKGTKHDLNISSYSSNQSIYIYLRMTIAEDDEDSIVNIVASTSRPDCSAIPTHEEYGSFNLLLFTLKADSREVVKNVRIIKPGVAKNALNLLSTGKIGEAKVSDIFLNDWSGVQYAKNCDVAAEAMGFRGGSINIVSNDLSMPNRGVYLLQRSMIVDENSSITIGNGEEKKYEFTTLLSGRTIVAVCASTNSSNDLDFKNPANGYQKGTPSQFGLVNNKLIVKIDSNGKKVTVRNQSSEQVTISGLHIMILMYGGK